MRKIIATEYVSLDGVIEEPGKWAFEFWTDEAPCALRLFAGRSISEVPASTSVVRQPTPRASAFS